MAPDPEQQPPQRSLREMAATAVRFWEPARILYNVVLLLIVVGFYFASQPYVRLTVDIGLSLFVLGVLANIAFCAAYPIDIFLQFTGMQDLWHSARWVVLGVGVVFAGIIAYFILGGLFLAIPAQN